MRAKQDLAATRRFLLSRGIWLVGLEFSLVNFGLWFNPDFDVLIVEVIAAIGFGILSALVSLPFRSIGFIGGIIVALHGLVALIRVLENVLAKVLMAISPPWLFRTIPGNCFLLPTPRFPGSALCFSVTVRAIILPHPKKNNDGSFYRYS